MDYTIRELKKQERHVLNDFLYEAIFIPEGNTIFDMPVVIHITHPDSSYYTVIHFSNKAQVIFLISKISYIHQEEYMMIYYFSR